MAVWYYSGNYQGIIDHINNEVRDFLMYFVLKTMLPKMATI